MIPKDFLYLILAKRAIYDCKEIDPDFADMLFGEPVVFRNSEFIQNQRISDDEHLRSMKLLFLCEMNREYGDHFFGSNAELTEQLFDTWWTITRTCDIRSVANVIKQVSDADFTRIFGTLDVATADRLREFRDDD